MLAPPSAAPYDRIRTTPTKPTTKTKRLTTNARQTTTGPASSLVPEDSPSPSERTLCGNERITALNSAIDQLGPPDIELTPNSIMTRITEHYVSQSVTNEREHKSGSHVPNNFLGKKGPAHPPPAAVPPWPAAPPRLPRIPPRLLVAPPQPAAAALRWPAPPTSARPGWRLSEKCQLNVRKSRIFWNKIGVPLVVWGSPLLSLVGVSRGCFAFLSLWSVLCSLVGGWLRGVGPRGRLRRAGGWWSRRPWRGRGRCRRSGRCLLLPSSPAARRSVGPPPSRAPGRRGCLCRSALRPPAAAPPPRSLRRGRPRRVAWPGWRCRPCTLRGLRALRVLVPRRRAPLRSLRARASGPAAGSGGGSRVRARLRPRLAVGLPCSPLFCCLLGGVSWSLSRPAPPLSSLSRVGPCRRCWCALGALAPLGCWSPASGPCRRPRPSPAAPLSGRVAPWRSALALVARLARGRCRARCSGSPPAARLARVACCLWWVGSAACPPPWRALGCLMCNSAVRCSSCPPSSPAGAPVPLVRCAPVARWFAPCPLCGALGLVLVTSGAARPFLWCAWCGVASPAPARSRWSSSREPAAVQPSLF